MFSIFSFYGHTINAYSEVTISFRRHRFEATSTEADFYIPASTTVNVRFRRCRRSDDTNAQHKEDTNMFRTFRLASSDSLSVDASFPMQHPPHPHEPKDDPRLLHDSFHSEMRLVFARSRFTLNSR